MELTDSDRLYWSRNLRITAVLVSIWFFVSFVLVYFSRELSFTFFGWPFSVWVAGQGALIVYCLIVWYYQRAMNRLDAEHNMHEEA
jgi:putative solute:sodium symporter small subunit